ncbi:MAG: hypothetical protein ABI024_15985 [Vicinamibacterales bacterium]
MLPQVLAGLGAVSTLSAGCIVWLQRFQPLFASIAIGGLVYQAWLVSRRPPPRRTRMMLAILWTSVGTTAAIAAAMVVLWQRYR